LDWGPVLQIFAGPVPGNEFSAKTAGFCASRAREANCARFLAKIGATILALGPDGPRARKNICAREKPGKAFSRMQGFFELVLFIYKSSFVHEQIMDVHDL